MAMNAVSIPHEDGYRAHLLLEKRLSANTVSAYLGDLRFCLRQLEGEDVSRLDPEAVRKLFAGLADIGLSPATMLRYLAALRSYAAYWLDAGILAADPCTGLRVPKQQRYKPRSLSLKEIKD